MQYHIERVSWMPWNPHSRIHEPVNQEYDILVMHGSFDLSLDYEKMVYHLENLNYPHYIHGEYIPSMDTDDDGWHVLCYTTINEVKNRRGEYTTRTTRRYSLVYLATGRDGRVLVHRVATNLSLRKMDALLERLQSEEYDVHNKY